MGTAGISVIIAPGWNRRIIRRGHWQVLPGAHQVKLRNGELGNEVSIGVVEWRRPAWQPTESSPAADKLAETSARLAGRISDGDLSAEARLFELYSHGVRLMLEKRTGDRELANDLAQDTFVVLIERLRSRPLDDPHRLSAFLHSTARNILVAWQRKQIRRRTDINSDIVGRQEDRSPNQYDLVRAEQTKKLVTRLIDELANDRDRAILFRYYILEQEKSVIRAELALSELHFNRVLYRARVRMRALLEATAEWRSSMAP